MSDPQNLKSFCVAPWLVSHVDPLGVRRLCCQASPVGHGQNLAPRAEFVNSDYMKATRRSMLNGALPKECSLCVSRNRLESYRETLNNQFQDLIPEILKHTTEEGETTIKPVYLDYRTDTCNLKCRTCGSHSSSSWTSHLKQHRAQYDDLQKDLERENNLSHEKIRANDDILAEFQELVSENQIRYLYFAGGEPTKNPGHLETLKRLIQNQQARNIAVQYNTNLTMTESFLKDWCDLLVQFKDVSILVSIDGLGANAEYVRSGLKWERFQKNMDLLKSYHSQIKIFLDPTVTSLLFCQTVEFAQYSLKYRFPILTKLMIEGLDLGAHLRVEFMPLHLRHELSREWNDYYYSLAIEDREFLGVYNQILE